MNILAIDTSTNVLGVALVSDQKIIGEYITNIKRNHSTRVLPAVESLLKECGVQVKEIDKIAVAEGPGSYTGVRIGVTIAKTLAWTLHIPLVGVSSLKLLAANARYFDGYLSPLMDARRGNLYTGLYQYQNGQLIQTLEDQHVSADDWSYRLGEYGKPILFLGEDVSLHREVLDKNLGDLASYSVFTENIPRPSELGLLSIDQEVAQEDLHAFIPNYARLAEAEMKWREKTGK